jgi:hypothetical protein
MVDDAIDHGEIREEGNGLHLSATLGTKEWINLIHFSDHLGPAPPGDLRAFLLDDQELMLPFL